MSRNDTCARVVHLVGCASHVSNAMRVTTIRAPWEPAEVNSDPRPETAPSPAPIRGQRPRAASISTVLRIIRQEHQAHGEARQ